MCEVSYICHCVIFVGLLNRFYCVCSLIAFFFNCVCEFVCNLIVCVYVCVLFVCLTDGVDFITYWDKDGHNVEIGYYRNYKKRTDADKRLWVHGNLYWKKEAAQEKMLKILERNKRKR